VPDELPYNPLDVDQLGVNVADSLLHRSVTPLTTLAQFNGAGVYAIYYTGEQSSFDPYALLAQGNRDEPFSRPIYVGKAVPSGARKGGRSANAVGPKLFGRLNEHAQSIQQATNLVLTDFHCRYLVVEDIWIPLGESLLIDRFQTLWNVIVEGFGNHPPGGGRKKQRRSMWDMIHPGRDWAAELPENDLSKDAIIQLISKALAGTPVLTLSPQVQREEADSDEQQPLVES